MTLLDNINSPDDLKKLDIHSLPQLCEEIREYLISTISQTGGHLAPNLGTVELTVALHYAFHSPQDKFIWDVGHQSYTHKILTGRKEELKKIRKTGGISGFPKREESKHDHYNAGHAGTSISQAIGEAVANELTHKRKKRSSHLRPNIISVIGDASIATGLSFEAMNHGGHLKIPFLIILNDNKMSISQNVGSVSYILTSLISTRLYKGWKHYWFRFVRLFPIIGTVFERMMVRFGANMKSLITEHQFFEELGFRYLGPLEGHDVVKMVLMLKKLRNLDEPTLLHVVTKKGKGYHPAEKNPTSFHGTPPFELSTGQVASGNGQWGLSEFAGRGLTELGAKDKKICVITPAMTEGSGLTSFAAKFPKRFFDTGIAEGHATTFAGSLAKADLNPFLCIYSTFLQRGFDQLIHDIALMKLPVKLVIDRAGVVGADGETHQGLHDIAIFYTTPGVELLSASSGEELLEMLEFMQSCKNPIAVRFPRASAPKEQFETWKNSRTPGAAKSIEPQRLLKGKDAVIFTEGGMSKNALKAAEILKNKKIFLEVVSLRRLKPLDKKSLLPFLKNKKHIFCTENHHAASGVGAQLGALLAKELCEKSYHIFGWPDQFIEHGSIGDLEKKYGLDPESIASAVEKAVKN